MQDIIRCRLTLDDARGERESLLNNLNDTNCTTAVLSLDSNTGFLCQRRCTTSSFFFNSNSTLKKLKRNRKKLVKLSAKVMSCLPLFKKRDEDKCSINWTEVDSRLPNDLKRYQRKLKYSLEYIKQRQKVNISTQEQLMSSWHRSLRIRDDENISDTEWCSFILISEEGGNQNKSIIISIASLLSRTVFFQPCCPRKSCFIPSASLISLFFRDSLS